MTIRFANPSDVTSIREVERVAGDMFAEIGMEDVAADEPASPAVLLRYIRDGRAWVAEADGHVVGYALVDIVDGSGHLEQLSIHPRYGRQGIGRRLIDAIIVWARVQGLPALTLLTFRDVPWNGPYYARLGFRPLQDDELAPELRSLRAHERELVLDIDARQAMVIDVRP